MPEESRAAPHRITVLQRWRHKFVCALRGIVVGVRGQSSFVVHLPAASLVLVAGAVLEVSHAEWLAIILSITLVLAAELFNSALEHLARAVSREEHPEIRNALDVASGAVLVTAVGACVVGAVVLL